MVGYGQSLSVSTRTLNVILEIIQYWLWLGQMIMLLAAWQCYSAQTLRGERKCSESNLPVIDRCLRCHGTDRYRWRYTTPIWSQQCSPLPKIDFTVPPSLVRQTPANPQPIRLHLPRRTLALPAQPSEFPVPPLGTINRPASPDHLFQSSWVGAEPAPD